MTTPFRPTSRSLPLTFAVANSTRRSRPRSGSSARHRRIRSYTTCAVESCLARATCRAHARRSTRLWRSIRTISRRRSTSHVSTSPRARLPKGLRAFARLPIATKRAWRPALRWLTCNSRPRQRPPRCSPPSSAPKRLRPERFRRRWRSSTIICVTARYRRLLQRHKNSLRSIRTTCVQSMPSRALSSRPVTRNRLSRPSTGW